MTEATECYVKVTSTDVFSICITLLSRLPAKLTLKDTLCYHLNLLKSLFKVTNDIIDMLNSH